jgi:4,5-dihydroxyphthalate decarboxylase
VTPQDCVFDFEEVPVLIQAFRRMVRGLEFDVTEMAITTYMVAKEHGKPFTALPVFLVRGFHHGAVLHNTRSGVRDPKDLEGARAGVNRGYTVTTGVWARGILALEHGVDLDRVTWVLSGDEHVEEYVAPPNVELWSGANVSAMLASGELPAAVGVTTDHPDVAPLIPDAEEAGYRALTERGLYPINHLIVVKDELLAAHPGLAADVFGAFAAAKRRYVDRLRGGTLTEPGVTDRMYQRVMDLTGEDPLPYGIGPNRANLETLIDMAMAQHILTRRPAVEDLFAAGTRDLTG